MKMGVLQLFKRNRPTEGVSDVTLQIQGTNVEMTYPCFHEREVETLTEAVDVMGCQQLGRKFGEGESAKIVDYCKLI
jgi:hypothetical protein